MRLENQRTGGLRAALRLKHHRYRKRLCGIRVRDRDGGHIILGVIERHQDTVTGPSCDLSPEGIPRTSVVELIYRRDADLSAAGYFRPALLKRGRSPWTLCEERSPWKQSTRQQ